jgi:hypothetical protein
VDFQIDPLSGGIAVIALIVSIIALRVAKKEPDKARLRANRDVIRQSLIDLEDIFTQVEMALHIGRDVDDVSPGVASSKSLLGQLAPRLPEHSTLQLIRSFVTAVEQAWTSTVYEQNSANRATQSVRDWEARVEQDRVDNPTSPNNYTVSTLARYRDEALTTTRAREGKRLSLKDDISAARPHIRRYIEQQDTQDRVASS